MNKSAFAPEPEDVMLHGRIYAVKPVSLRRLLTFTDLVGVIIDDIAPPKEQAKGVTNIEWITRILGLLKEKPGEMLQILIPDLDMEAFNDEDGGATVPEIWYTLATCTHINHLTWLKNLWPALQQIVERFLTPKTDIEKLLATLQTQGPTEQEEEQPQAEQS